VQPTSVSACHGRISVCNISIGCASDSIEFHIGHGDMIRLPTSAGPEIALRRNLEILEIALTRSGDTYSSAADRVWSADPERCSRA
jgi:hypothetical protein